MGKLHLVVADPDKAYLESLVNYVMANHSQKFQVSSFTEAHYLQDHLKKSKIDILLLSPELFTPALILDKGSTVVLLTSGKNTDRQLGVMSINKYQQGEKLVSDLLNVISESNPNAVVPGGVRRAKVVAVYSPIGGIGKTTISIASSILSAEKGKEVFYLNLESISTLPLFFRCDNEHNFSNALYFLKDKKKSLSMKIEGIKMKDPNYKVSYLAPPESVVDINEMTTEDMTYLIHEIQDSGLYDFIYLDLSSALDKKNLAAMEASDEIYLILSQGEYSAIKLNIFLKELEVLSRRSDSTIPDKITPVINKYMPGVKTKIESLNINGKNIMHRIPRVAPLLSSQGDRYSINLNSAFGSSIRQLISI